MIHCLNFLFRYLKRIFKDLFERQAFEDDGVYDWDMLKKKQEQGKYIHVHMFIYDFWLIKACVCLSSLLIVSLFLSLCLTLHVCLSFSLSFSLPLFPSLSFSLYLSLSLSFPLSLYLSLLSLSLSIYLYLYLSLSHTLFSLPLYLFQLKAVVLRTHWSE